MDRNVTKYWFVRALRFGQLFLAMLVLALAETPAQASTIIITRTSTAQHSTIAIADAATGIPLPGTMVLVYSNKDLDCTVPCKPTVALAADEHGNARLPRLPYGDYSIVARNVDGKRGEAWIRISRWKVCHRKRIVIGSELTREHGFSTSDLHRIETETPIWVRSFRGVVNAACNGQVPSAVLSVIRKGGNPNNILWKVQIDLEGRFSMPLDAGEYAVRIDSDQCIPEIALVVVSDSASDEEIHFELRQVAVTE
jgi:hypothetical protein